MDTRIKELCEDHDYTQDKIASILNCSQRAYSHYEIGDREIPLEFLIKLADLYNVSIDYLLKRTNTKQ